MRASLLPDNRRAQVRACGVVMQEAATVLDATGDEALMQLGWDLKRLTVRIYELLPQAPAGESSTFNAELARRIAAAVPTQGIAGAHEVTKSERRLLSEPGVYIHPGAAVTVSIPRSSERTPSGALTYKATYGSDDEPEYSPGLMSSQFLEDDEMSRSHL